MNLFVISSIKKTLAAPVLAGAVFLCGCAKNIDMREDGEIKEYMLDSSKFPVKDVEKIRVVQLTAGREPGITGYAVGVVQEEDFLFFDSFNATFSPQIFQQDVDNDGYDELVLIIHDGVHDMTINIYRLFENSENRQWERVFFEPIDGGAIYCRNSEYEFKDGKLIIRTFDWQREVIDTRIYKIERNKIVLETEDCEWQMRTPRRFMAQPVSETERIRMADNGRESGKK